jgi:prephenate dehydratase
VVKLVGSPVAPGRLRALYFTRATAPLARGALPHHVGLYAIAGGRWIVSWRCPPHRWSCAKNLEQLRALEAGMRIDAAVIDHVPFGVDTAEYLERARAVPVRPEPRMSQKNLVPGRARRELAYRLPGGLSGLAGAALPDLRGRFRAVSEGQAGLGMIPIENSIAGPRRRHPPPAADLGAAHRRRAFFADPFPASGAARRRASETVRTVQSHVHALGQCRKIIRKLGLKASVAATRRGRRARWRSRAILTRASLAPRLAAEVYRLKILAEDVEDEAPQHDAVHHPVQDPGLGGPENGPDRDELRVPGPQPARRALQGLGGFATNGVNMTKLESYMIEGQFFTRPSFTPRWTATRRRDLKRALEELGFFSRELHILGVYPAHPFGKRSGNPRG